MLSNNPLYYVIAGAAAVTLAAGGYALGNSGSDDQSATAASAAPAQTQPQSGAPSQPDQLPRDGGQGRPDFGAPATGSAASKATAAALAKYKGTAERVMKLDSGSYEVHVITPKGEYHVAVSKDFKVTGAAQGGPGGPGGPGATLPGDTSGAAPQSGTGTGTSAGTSSL